MKEKEKNLEQIIDKISQLRKAREEAETKVLSYVESLNLPEEKKEAIRNMIFEEFTEIWEKTGKIEETIALVTMGLFNVEEKNKKK